MKILLAFLLLSVSFVSGHRILEKLEKALKNEDRAALKPLFNASFTFEISHDHTGDADEAIDWILNKTVHGPYKSMLYAENPNNKEGLVVDVIFRGTHVHLLLTINIEAQIIFRGAFQTVGDPDGKYTEAPPETEQPETTTKPTTKVPLKSPQQKWYSELLKAIHNKNSKRISSLIGYGFNSTKKRDQIIHQLLKKYKETNMFDRFNAFVVDFDYAESGRIQIRGYVNSKKVVKIQSIQLDTAEQIWYLNMIKAIDINNRYLVSTLIGNEFESDSTRETIIDTLLERYRSAKITNLVEGPVLIIFRATFESFKNSTVKITGRVLNDKVSITSIQVKQQIEKPNGNTWYKELIEAINEKNEKNISKLIGYEFKSTSRREEIIRTLVQKYKSTNIKSLLGIYVITFSYADETDVTIYAKETETNVQVYRIYIKSQKTTSPLPTPIPVPTTPFQLYQALLEANKNQDSDTVSILIGNNFKSKLPKELIVRTILRNYTSSDFKKTSHSTFIIRFDYTSHASLEIVGKYTYNRVTITEIRQFFHPAKTTTSPKAPSEIFVEELIAAIKSHKKVRIEKVIGTTYTSTVSKTEIVQTLTQIYTNLHVEPKVGEDFSVYIDYEGEKTLIITCRGGKVRRIELISKRITSTTSNPRTTVIITKTFYRELIDAAKKKNETNVWKLIGKTYVSELTKKEIIKQIFEKFTNTELRSSNHYTTFEIEFQYEDKSILLFHGDVVDQHVVVEYITIIRKKTPVSKPREEFYELLVDAARQHNKTTVDIIIGKEYISNIRKAQVLTTIIQPYIDVEFRNISKRDFEIIFDYSDGNRLVLICTQILERVTVTYIKYSQRTTQTTPKPFVLTIEIFKERIVEASKEKNASAISILIGNNYETNVNKTIILKTLTSDFVNVTMQKLLYRYFQITFNYEDGSQLIIYCEVIKTGIRVARIQLYKNTQKISTTTTTSYPVAQKEPRTPEEFYEMLKLAIAAKNVPRIQVLIGTTYKTVGGLTENQIIELLLTKPNHPDFFRAHEHLFEVSFKYKNGSILHIYGQPTKIRPVNISLIAFSIPSTTSAPRTTTTPPDVYPTPPTTTGYVQPPTTTQCPEKILIGKYKQVEDEWKKAVARNNTKQLEKYIDEDFEMTFDEEGTSMRRRRFIRGLIEGFHLFTTPDKLEAVREETGLIKIEGCIGEHEVRAWFAEGDKYWILKRAFYDKNVLERKKAKKCVA